MKRGMLSIVVQSIAVRAGGPQATETHKTAWQLVKASAAASQHDGEGALEVGFREQPQRTGVCQGLKTSLSHANQIDSHSNRNKTNEYSQRRLRMSPSPSALPHKGQQACRSVCILQRLVTRLCVQSFLPLSLRLQLSEAANISGTVQPQTCSTARVCCHGKLREASGRRSKLWVASRS